jgi:hypothetical protein
MKKVFLALIVVAVGLVATAQHVPPLDTLRGPDPTYFYPAHFWNYTVNRDGPFFYWGVDGGGYSAVANGRYSDTTIRVVGLAVAARQEPGSDPKYTHRVLT